MPATYLFISLCFIIFILQLPACSLLYPDHAELSYDSGTITPILTLVNSLTTGDAGVTRTGSHHIETVGGRAVQVRIHT